MSFSDELYSSSSSWFCAKSFGGGDCSWSVSPLRFMVCLDGSWVCGFVLVSMGDEGGGDGVSGMVVGLKSLRCFRVCRVGR